MTYVARRSITLFLLFIAIACLIMAIRPFRINYALYDLMPNKAHSMTPDSVQQKMSAQLNVVFQGNDFDKLKSAADTLYQKLDAHQIKNISYYVPDVNLENIKDYFKRYQYAFLRSKDRLSIQNGETKQILSDSINHISSSLLPPVLSVVDDPFSLFSKYTDSLFENLPKWHTKEGVLWQYDAPQNYILMNIEINPDNVDEANRQVETIINCLNKNEDGVFVHLTGIPLHTYKMYTKSKIEITMISFVSLISILVLSFLLLKKWGAVWLVFFNLLIGFLSGAFFLYLFFNEVHILSFAFGASLIGLCIDYSFHRMYAAYSIDDVKKNMLHSFMTTACCFISLIFSEISLLRQIAIFTLGGLIGTFVWVNLLPHNEHKITAKPFNEFPRLTDKQRKIIFSILLLFLAFAVKSLNFHTDIADFYTPDEKLKKEEQLFYTLNDTGSSIFFIKGQNLEDVLQKEEDLRTTYGGFGISYFLPSQKIQKSNYELFQKLYESESLNIKNELGLEEVPTLKAQNILDKKAFMKTFGKAFYDKFIIHDKEDIWSVFTTTSEIKETPQNVFQFNAKKTLNASIQQYTQKAFDALVIGFIFLAFILLYFYKKRAFLYLLPSLISVLGTLIFINLFYGGVSFFHVISLFIVVGLSLDYTIFHLNAKNNNTFKPVMFSFLSSVIGFGLLSFISFNVVAVMGQTIAVGLTLSYILSLLLIEKRLE